MRLALLDVGSAAARLELVDLDRSRMPRVTWSFKARTRLAENTGADGVVSEAGIERAVNAVRECVRATQGIPNPVVAFGTSAVRDAANGAELRERLSAAAGVRIGVLSPHREAALTYHAARRWFGGNGPRLTTVDIGGGTADVTSGTGSEPEDVVSFPFGAVRLTSRYLPDDPPSPQQIAEMTEVVERDVSRALQDAPAPLGHAVALSKVLRQLAVLTASTGDRVVRHPERLVREGVRSWIPRLAVLNRKQRAALPGVSRSRARRILAGAILAVVILDTIDADTLSICPWGLREGLVFRFVDAYDQSTGDAVPAAVAEMFG